MNTIIISTDHSIKEFMEAMPAWFRWEVQQGRAAITEVDRPSEAEMNDMAREAGQ